MDRKKNNMENLTDDLLNTLSAEGEEQLKKWEEQSSSHRKLRNILRKINVSPQISALGEEMRESILIDIHKRIEKTTRRSFIIKVSTIAASLILLFCLTNYLSYKKGYKQLSSQVIQMTNPLGMQSSITLSDGTKVILNAGSTISYPTAFVKKYREVEIEGEAFFEVQHEEEKPFIVKADAIRVKVLGTKFNVKAYKEEKNIDVTLEEGSVGVGFANQHKYIEIIPGQQVRFDKTRRTFMKRQVNLNYYITWKDGLFHFNSMTFEDIARQLERRFNVSIEIASDKLKQTIYTGDFVRKENLEQILRVMTADRRFKYKIEDDVVRIYE